MSATEQAVENLLNEDDWTGKIYSDGWVDAPETVEIIEPATGESLGVAGVANAASVAAATKSAAKAQRAWAATPLSERIAIVRRAGEILDRHRDEIVGWLVRETGSVPPKADVEVTASIGQFEMAASITEDQLEQVLESAVPGRASTARRQPLGVVGVITPWNFPLVLAMRSLGPAFVLGNAAVLKGDLNTPVTGCVLIARIFEEAGLPSGRAARPLRRRRGRAGARRGPARADDLVHRLDRDRPPGRRSGRAHAQASRAGARRQQPADRARRRRHRGRVVRRRLGLVPAPGPDLPRGQQASRARVDRRGVPRGAHGAGRTSPGRGSGIGAGRDRAADQREADRARAANRRRDGRSGRYRCSSAEPATGCSSRRRCCAT